MDEKIKSYRFEFEQDKSLQIMTQDGMQTIHYISDEPPTKYDFVRFRVDMNEAKHDPEHIEQVAKAIGEALYGHVDKICTPNTWQMSIDLAEIAIDKWEEINLKIVTGGLD